MWFSKDRDIVAPRSGDGVENQRPSPNALRAHQEVNTNVRGGPKPPMDAQGNYVLPDYLKPVETSRRKRRPQEQQQVPLTTRTPTTIS